MNDNSTTIRELLTHLKDKGLVRQDDVEKITGSLGNSEQVSKDPIYIRILLGIGAWVFAVFLFYFLLITGIVGLNRGIGDIICGIIFLVGACFIDRASKGTFLNQLSLALVFAVNIITLLMVYADAFNDSSIINPDTHTPILRAQTFICIIIYPIYANSIYRFIAPTALAVFATWWIIEEKTFDLMHNLIAAEALLAGILLLPKKRPPFLTPLGYSAATMLPATILFMNLMLANTWRIDFNEPVWPSSLMLWGGLLYLFFHLAGGRKGFREPWLILAFVFTLLLGIFTTPGILVAIGLLIVGYAFGDRILAALSLLFLPCFLFVFYYALNVDFAYKSWVIAGSGVLLLVVRWIAGRCQPDEVAA